MPDFNPFSDEGKIWLETHCIEDQYDTLEYIGEGLTRTHSNTNIKINKNPIEISKQKRINKQILAKKGLHLFNMTF